MARRSSRWSGDSAVSTSLPYGAVASVVAVVMVSPLVTPRGDVGRPYQIPLGGCRIAAVPPGGGSVQLEPDEIKSVITRLKRANGHLASVVRMLEEGSECEDALTQLAAVSKAISRGGYALVAAGLQ